MALSLNAEQKSLLKIFKIEEKYIIPAYQRPYSWGYEQCYQLYIDLMNNFKPENELNLNEYPFDDTIVEEKNEQISNEYFLGNIIIAKSEEKQEKLEIIDGQQRLTTLLLLIKVLSVLNKDLTILQEIIYKKDWSGKDKGYRLESNIFETDDNEKLKNILGYDENKFIERYNRCSDSKLGINERLCSDKFEINALYFYYWLKDYKELNSFIEFLLKKIYLLPIELSGRTQEEAKNKALAIFETINNRGMNLEDADIFKAKLYEKAERVGEERSFIEQWGRLKDSCEKLNLQIDDIFRYYTHIIRGQKGITTSEINLRRFFEEEQNSPFKHKKYDEILTDLFDLSVVVEITRELKYKDEELSKWLQLVDLYTNQYPKIAIIAYLFKNKDKSSIELTQQKIDDFREFLVKLVRFCYEKGSTTTIKFEIYNIIKNIFSDTKIEEYSKIVSETHFNYMGGLKNAYALLAYYLNPNNKNLSSVVVDKIVTLKDEKYFLEQGWSNEQFNEVLNMIGNLIVWDIPKRNINFVQKREYIYTKENDFEIKKLVQDNFSFEAFKNRDEELKLRIKNFIKGSL